MKVTPGRLTGLVLIEPKVFGDSRGFFLETWNQKKYEDAGIAESFVQDNVSVSRRGALRGLHFQNPNPQGKLVSVLQGEVLDVVVDIRARSATFGQYETVLLSGENKLQFYIPPGFAHGFAVLSETAMFHYKCTGFYSPRDEATLLWNDPAVGIPWPLSEPVVSEKDAKGFLLKDIPREKLYDLP